MTIQIAFYVSGHGWGHATRVSALLVQLLQLDVEVHIVSSAPTHVFHECLELGAHYRSATIDPVIVQPLAYNVDRQKSLEALEQFILDEPQKLALEHQWLSDIKAECVLSDSAYLGCIAAYQARIPSVLVTNFTFDSVFSYLSAHVHADDDLAASFVQSKPIPRHVLQPLVDRMTAGYQNADLLVRLPGHIPIPSFMSDPHAKLPSTDWIDAETETFKSGTSDLLAMPVDQLAKPASIPYDTNSSIRHRDILEAPLLVRLASTSPQTNPYTVIGRATLLSSMGIPSELHQRKLLVVSFGGQTFRRPASRSGHSTPNSSLTQIHEPEHGPSVQRRIATPSHIFIPGAPPASKPNSPTVPLSATFPTISIDPAPPQEDEPRLLPDETWIAVICGISKEQWIQMQGDDENGDEHLPEGFYLAPKDVNMVDLTAAADVLLGKLGYGTMSECLDGCTPFVYVSRPLFIEEHGLKRLLSQQGVGVELSRSDYEDGNWTQAIEIAYNLGHEQKEIKRNTERDGGCHGVKKRQKDGQVLAQAIIDWIHEWYKLYAAK